MRPHASLPIPHSSYSGAVPLVHCVNGITPLAPPAVRSIDDLPRVAQECNIAIAIIATPASAAQDVADRLTAAGVPSILNFAPTVISVPEAVSLRKVDLAVELQILSFYQQRRAGGPPVALAD